MKAKFSKVLAMIVALSMVFTMAAGVVANAATPSDYVARVYDYSAKSYTYYDSLEEAVIYVNELHASYAEAGVTVNRPALYLNKDVVLNAPVEINGDVTFMYSNHTITSVGTAIVINGVTVSLNAVAGGGISAGAGDNISAVVINSDSNVTIVAGNYYVGPNLASLANSTIKVNGNANLTINGSGYFKTAAADAAGFYPVIDQGNDATGTVQIKGGAFENFDPANGDDVLEGSYLASGYSSYVRYDNDTPIYDVKATDYEAVIGNTRYNKLSDAITAAQNGDTIVLQMNISQDAGYYVAVKDITIDLNNKDISVNKDTAFTVHTAGKLTITGNGNVSGGTGADFNALQAYMPGSKIVVKGGTYSVGSDAQGYGNAAVYACDRAEVEIYDGYFSTVAASSNGLYYVLNLSDLEPGTITVYGGSFVNQDISTGDLGVAGSAFVADGYTVSENEGVYTVIAKTPVASIGGVTYTDLGDALAVGGEVTLLDNIAVTETIVVPEGITATLNLNGKNIDGLVVGYVIENRGNLTITGNGTVYNTEDSKQGNGSVSNYGSITIENGTFGGALQRGAAFGNYATAVVNGGSFRSCDNYVNGGYAYALVNYDGTMEVNNASVYGKMNGVIAANKGSITVNSGSYVLDGENSFYVFYATEGKILVNGGNFTKTGNTRAFVTAPDNSVTIKGGSFNADISAYVAEDYEVKEADGIYTVSAPNYVVAADGVNYKSFDEAIAAVSANGTIKLLSDINLGVKSYTIDGKAFTLDLNGFTLNAVADGAANASKTYFMTLVNGSVVTVDDSSSSKAGTIKVTYLANSTLLVFDVCDTSKFILNNGTLTNGADVNYGATIVYLRNSASFEMNGGTVAAIKNPSAAKRVYSLYMNDLTNTAVINAGVVSSDYLNGINYVGSLTINGGEISAAGVAVSGSMGLSTLTINDGRIVNTAGGNAVSAGQNNTLSIAGGIFGGAVKVSTASKAAITGGTFTTDPSAYVVKGYAATFENNVYTVAKKAYVQPTLTFENDVVTLSDYTECTTVVGIAYTGTNALNPSTVTWEQFISAGMVFTSQNTTRGYQRFSAPSDGTISELKVQGNYTAFVKYVNASGQTKSDYYTFKVEAKGSAPEIMHNAGEELFKVETNGYIISTIGIAYIGQMDIPGIDWNKFIDAGKKRADINTSAGYRKYFEVSDSYTIDHQGYYGVFVKYIDISGTTKTFYRTLRVGEAPAVPGVIAEPGQIKLNANGFTINQVGIAYVGEDEIVVPDWSTFYTNGLKYRNINGSIGHKKYNTPSDGTAWEQYVTGYYSVFIKASDANGNNFTCYSTIYVEGKKAEVPHFEIEGSNLVLSMRGFEIVSIGHIYTSTMIEGTITWNSFIAAGMKNTDINSSAGYRKMYMPYDGSTLEYDADTGYYVTFIKYIDNDGSTKAIYNQIPAGGANS